MTEVDPMMEAISNAVATGRAGNTTDAQTELLELWHAIGITGDPLHRCALSHYLADLYSDPAQSRQQSSRTPGRTRCRPRGTSTPLRDRRYTENPRTPRHCVNQQTSRNS